MNDDQLRRALTRYDGNQEPAPSYDSLDVMFAMLQKAGFGVELHWDTASSPYRAFALVRRGLAAQHDSGATPAEALRKAAVRFAEMILESKTDGVPQETS